VFEPVEQSQKHRLRRDARVLSAIAEARGLELGETLKIGSRESVRRYAARQDGTYYGAHLEKVFQRREAA
jgi:hypothetical protein